MPEKRHILARLRPRAWSAETWVCSMRGHVAPAAHVETLEASDGMLGVELSDGNRLVRCLRCDLWLAESAPRHPIRPTLGPVDALPKPRRGAVLDEGIRTALYTDELAAPGMNQVRGGLYVPDAAGACPVVDALTHQCWLGVDRGSAQDFINNDAILQRRSPRAR